MAAITKIESEKHLELDIQSIQASLEAMEIARKIVESYCKESGCSRTDFAKLVGRDASFLSRILNGRVDNMNYQTFARIILAAGHWPMIHLEPIHDTAKAHNYVHSKDGCLEYKAVGNRRWSVTFPAAKAEARNAATFKTIESARE